jgi:hypothetical protein
MDNIFNNNNISSSEDSEEEEDFFNNKDEIFMSMSNKKEYEKNRNTLFTPDIITKKIVVDSHNYYQGDEGFSTSNFDVVFDYKRNVGNNTSSLITANYDIYKDVIGFRLINSTIRTPPYNINKTNNIIRYVRSTNPSIIHTITINPGQYDITDMKYVFRKFEGALDSSEETIVNIHKKYTQYITYSDPDVDPTVDEGTRTFTVDFFNVNNQSMSLPDDESLSDLNGIKFIFSYSGDSSGVNVDGDPIDKETVTILWDHDNITRGVARLFGFLPKSRQSKYINGDAQKSDLYSDRVLDISSHFVDLVIPEIPSIACKRNSSGREIIDRIQLAAGHGEYLHYRSIYEGNQTCYFNPMKLHRLSVQLWAANNEIYDTNNSDVSFEFEITMLKNKKLLM